MDGVSFGVGGAEIVGLLGRNGAGKTTSFRMTIGMIDADSGSVRLDGRDLSGLPMYRRARLGMGYLSQEPSVFQRLTVRAEPAGDPRDAAPCAAQGTQTPSRRRAASNSFGLDPQGQASTPAPARAASAASSRSHRSLITRSASVILLDEPFSGVDPLAVEDLQREIRRLTEMGIAILITDHNVQQTLRVCDRAYIINEGRVLREGAPRELINDDLVKRSYLGSMFRGDEFDEPSPNGAPAEPEREPAASARPGGRP